MAGETICSFWVLKTTQTFRWQSSWWWKLLRILFPATQWIICSWISRAKGIHCLWDEGQIMKVIKLKKQTKFSSFYWLVSFTRPQEKAWKRKHSSDCFVSQHFFTWGRDQKHKISSLEDETKRLAKVHQFCSAMRRRIRFFYMLWQYKLDKNFDLTFEESGSLLSSMTANICFKMLMKSSVKHFPSTEFSRDFWKEASRSWVGGQWLALAASRLSHTDSRWTRAASVYSSSADIWPSK